MPEPTPARATHAWATFVAFSAELATMPDVVAKLAQAHTADDAGLCRACGRPGRGTAYVPWPCPLARLAQAAQAAQAVGAAQAAGAAGVAPKPAPRPARTPRARTSAAVARRA
ncbi:MAG TPA: hypothetical protein VD813_11645 [Pseudonocardia sp.]|nr:hypothetical protein [Pseudonocardia sp.]